MNVKVIKTVKNQQPMKESPVLGIEDDLGWENFAINLHPHIEYQTMKGFGGAFTEAASTTLDKMSRAQREKILKMYFDKEEGIGYNLGRVHMNSCDFSLDNYTCVEEGDETLATFQIQRDKASVIPMVKEAMAYGEIDMLASPWSPPAYMKTNNMMNHGGKLKKEYYELWSQYFVRFIEAYAKEGIDVKGVTIQNEPNATQTWDSCIYTAKEELEFAKNHLGPKMHDRGIKIFFWDHNKERLIDRADVVLADETARKYITGVAFHWYSGDHFEELEMFHKMYPEMDMFFSEGCYEYSRGALDTVKIGEKYAHDMIGNFNNYCNMFLDWNLLLNGEGGPNHVGNFCDAPIMADTETDEIIVHDSYYYIGHFSKFVQRGAVRIGCSRFTDQLETVAFKNPDGSIAAIVLNTTDKDMDFVFRYSGKLIRCTAEAHSIATYIIE